MDSFIIEGGRPLKGAIRVGGSKNAALPILIATLLTDCPCEIDNVPNLRDIRTTFRLLESLGKRIEYDGDAVRVLATGRLETRAPYEIVKQMRASVLVAGPLLARFGTVRVPIPGGCAIGMRPIDIHLQGFRALGATEHEETGDVVMRAARLKGRRVRLRLPSVGATENLMMAACLASGLTVIANAAQEPEIEDLGAFLNRLGASVEGAGTATVTVRGGARLEGAVNSIPGRAPSRAALGRALPRGAVHAVIPDRIESGTLLIAAAATGGSVRLEGACAAHLEAVLESLEAAGSRVRAGYGFIDLSLASRPKAVGIRTLPYPGFPTDLQAPWMSLMCLARGTCLIRETVFENRFLHAAELVRMGAAVRLRGSTARVEGRPSLNGAPVMASDIRGGAALVVAALAAKGRTILQRVYHIDRGYERLEVRLRRLGASIRRVRR
ncbi:MAG: UDP-N-acetylglucosamine 1-carboxyvinyltransferase [Elusimicrobia bacterium]|nr:UDP-N-acetylglucosamine 1-carboxyvinyltransferase [Elusimicrobiota bacterium]